MAAVSQVALPEYIAKALNKASRTTGIPFEYLLKTAERESRFNGAAQSKSSSATGLFQFIENTWLTTIKEEGAKFGLGQYASQIIKDKNGRYSIPDAAQRRQILNLRKDPAISAMIAGAYTQKNADYLKTKLNREPSQGELYAAHFLGPKGATRLIELAGLTPNLRADRFFQNAAKANPSIFYAGQRPRSTKQVLQRLTSTYDPSQPSRQMIPAPPNRRDVTLRAWQVEVKQDPLMHDLRPTILTKFEPRGGGSQEHGSLGIWQNLISLTDKNEGKSKTATASTGVPKPTRNYDERLASGIEKRARSYREPEVGALASHFRLSSVSFVDFWKIASEGA